MTCVLGIQQPEGCYIAADSASATEHYSDVSVAPKLFTPVNVPEIIIGGTDSWRMLQLLQYQLVMPPFEDFPSEHRYVYELVERARSLMRAGGYSEVKDSVEKGGNFLVAFRGQLFDISSDFHVSQYRSGLYACGSGFYYALGAMQMGRHIYMDRTAFLQKVLEATSTFQPAYVREPFLVRFQPVPEDGR